MSVRTWSGATNNNWSNAGNWDTKPTTGDDVVMANAVNCVVDEATAALNSLDMTGYTGTLSGSNNITVTVASGTSIVLFTGTSPTWSGTLLLNPATGTTINLTFGSLTTAGTCGGITIAGTTTGMVNFLDGITLGATKTVTLTSGTLHTDGATDNAGLTHSWGLFSSSNTNTRTLTLGASNITITGASWSTNDTTGLTLTTHTVIITLTSNSSVTFSPSTAVYNDVRFTGTGEAFIGNASFTIHNLTKSGGGSIRFFGVGTNKTIDTSFTINGSANDRILVTSPTVGTGVQLKLNGATISTNLADFRDIIFARTDAGGLDLTNGGANLIGDCGGNTRTGGDGTVTFTTSAPQTFAYGGVDYKWSTVGNWSGGRVPLPQDDVTSTQAFSGSPSWVLDMPRLGKSLDFSGTSGTTTILMSSSRSVFGSVTNKSNVLYNGAGYGFTFEGRGSFTLTSAGVNMANTYISAFGGTVTLQDALAISYNPSITINNGTLATNGYTFTGAQITTAGTSAAKTLNITNSTINLNNANTIITDAGTTVIATGSTINVTKSDTSNQNLGYASLGQTYNNLNIIGSGASKFYIAGSNTFTGAVSITTPRGLILAGGTLTTVADLKAYGTVANPIVIGATSLSATPPVLKKTGGGAIQTEFISAQGVNVMPLPIDGLDFLGQASSGDYVSASNSATRNQIYGATAYSVDEWLVVRSAGGSTSGRFFDKNSGSATAGVLMFANSTYQLAITIGADGTLAGLTSLAGDIKQNTLMHVGFSWTPGTKPLAYINGVVLPTLSGGTPTTAGDDSAIPMYIGNRTARDRTFDGKLYAMRIYRNIALTAANFLTLSTAGVKASNPLGNATSEYLFNDGTGTTVTDSIGAVNGTLTGATWFAGQTWFTGNHSLPDGKGINFGGQATAGDYIRVVNSATANQFYGSTAYSIEAWVIPRSTGGNAEGMFAFTGDSNTQAIAGFKFYMVASNYLKFAGFDTALRFTTANSQPLTLNALNHIVMSWTSGSAPKLYVNNVECTYSTATAIGTPSDDSPYNKFLGNLYNFQRTFDGIIFSERIYRNVGLSSANVTTAYNAGYKAVNPLGNATSEYLMNEGAGGIVTDRIGAVNGTIHQGSWIGQGLVTGEMPN